VGGGECIGPQDAENLYANTPRDSMVGSKLILLISLLKNF